MNPCSPSKGNKKRRNKSKTPPSVKKVIDDLFGARFLWCQSKLEKIDIYIKYLYNLNHKSRIVSLLGK